MQAEDRSSRSSRSSKSTVWIDPAYMRHGYVSEQEDAARSSQTAMSNEAYRHTTSSRDDSSRSRRRPGYRQPNPITPTPPTLDMLPNAPSPIPPRASALREQSARVPRKYRVTQFSGPDTSDTHDLPGAGEDDISYSASPAQGYQPVPRRQSLSRQTRKLTAALTQDAGASVTPRMAPQQQQPQAPLWQYDSPAFEIESSIAALALAVHDAPATVAPFAAEPPLLDDLPTHPVGAQFIVRSADLSAHMEPPFAGSTADLPTRPQLHAASPVADLPTRPDHRVQVSALAELDTVPPPVILSPALEVSAGRAPDLPTQALIPAHPSLLPLVNPQHPAGARLILRSADLPARGTRLIESTTDLPLHANAGLASWTAGGAGQSPLAHRLIERRGRHNSSSSVHLNSLDKVRWWLLKPGHIEFIAWLAGTVLLIALSLGLLFTTSLSFGWLTIGPLSRFSSSAGNAHPLPTIVTDPALKLELLGKEQSFLPGQSISLHGQGFTAGGNIFFTYDNMQPFPATSMVQADVHGAFYITLVLGTGSQWYPGLHLIEAHDLVRSHVAVVKINILAPASQYNGNGTTAPVSTTVPGKGTPTPISGSGNGNKPVPGPGPGGQTPVPVTPTATVGITPTPTLSPSPSPTATQTPAPTSTPVSTPTPTPTSPTPTPGVTPTPKP